VVVLLPVMDRMKVWLRTGWLVHRGSVANRSAAALPDPSSSPYTRHIGTSRWKVGGVRRGRVRNTSWGRLGGRRPCIGPRM
jgi:hypothetical protein